MFILRITFMLMIVFTCRMAAGGDDQLRTNYQYEKQGAYDVKLYGTIEEMPERGYPGVWIVNGRRINVTSDTVIKKKHGMPETGAYVAVEGHYSGQELSAYEIEVKRDSRNGSSRYNP